MADQAPEVKIKVTAEDQGVAAAIKALGDQLKDLKNQAKDTKSELGDLSGVLDKVISAELVYKVAEFGKEVFEATVNIERMSQKTGLSAGLLSTYGKAAEASGASSEQMNVAITRLASSITKFQEGSNQAAAAMKALGLSQKDFAGLSSDEKIRLVTDRLGAMKDGFLKTDVARQLFGKGGAQLLPTLQALAGDGFDEVTKAAQRSGQFLTDDMAADAASAAASFAELEGAGKGIATQFEAGLLPALNDVADALTQNVEDAGTSAFKSAGEAAGTVVKTLTLAWTIGADTIGAILLGIVDIAHGVIQQVANAELTIYQAADEAAHGHFKAAGQALADGVHYGVNQAKSDVDDFKSRFVALADLVTKTSGQLFPDDATAAARQKAREAKFKKTGDGSDDDPPKNPDKANKARLSLDEAALANELAVFKARNTAEEESNQVAYDQGLESLQKYFAKRKELARAESDEQIQILTKQRDAAAKAPTDGTEEQALAKRQKVAKYDAELQVARITAGTKQAQIDQAQFAAEEAHQKTVLGYQAQILAAQGRTYEAAVAQIASESAQVQRELVQSGLSPDKVAAMVQQIQTLKLATAQFDEQRKQGEDELKSLTDERDEIQLRASQGLILQVNAERQIAQVEASRVPQLRAIAEAMRLAAVTPQQKQQAQDFSRQIDQIAASANTAGKQMAQFKNQSVDAIAGDLTTFLGSTIDQVHGVGDAFRQLAGSVVGSIQKIVAQLIIQIAMQKLLKSITDSSGGGGGASGGVFGLLSSFASFSEGGAVSGPGSSTSDSIPARLSDGEFVIRASAVDAVGVNFLSALNRGLRVPSISSAGGVPRFAEGGLVQGGRSGTGGDVRLGIGLDEGLVLKHLSSKNAGKIIVQHIANNPKAATKALSRSS